MASGTGGNTADTEKRWAKYRATYLTPEETVLADKAHALNLGKH